ncbi:tRNA 2-selenouridine(34) synthase MnmH [Sulfurimicrobium lacus]|uniref:tRNA 2-selenouridine(34) synthase MnmH n=1 Tax=Sulfurimicrobium lacus TaxID=2715678 RepID=UPI001562EE8F|nr:tRNA 2-selenouridine(34) synthase MnmH [Sulfurimicrobium lacus]
MVNVAQLAEFDDIIDVRSPSEFADDHVPGALNFPVLDDEERARIGTMYKQVSSFDAKKAGAALVSRNIGLHLERGLAARPKGWKPLVYCWRGGQRSGSMAHVLGQIGWHVGQMDGGYKAYRRQVLEDLTTLPARFQWRVVCGTTGSGKSRLLQALQAAGAQVLDLEDLANHRGSLLGNIPDVPQPSQKYFESLVWAKLHSFDPALPVYAEAESKKIGNVRVPDTIIEAMWQGQCIRVEATTAQRVVLLKEEYQHFLSDPAALGQKLGFLTELHGKERIGRWQEMALRGEWDTLVGELLEQHYDPAYTRSTLKHYPHYAQGLVLQPLELGEAAMRELAQEILDGQKN